MRSGARQKITPASGAQAQPPLYGGRRAFLQGVLALALCSASPNARAAPDKETAEKEPTKAIRLVAFGDSLTAGFLLPAEAAFPAVLEKALRQEGYRVSVVNAGVSGDTASGGLARLDWALGDGADGLILELGANDMLRGVDPKITREALESILARLKERKIKALIAGMLAGPNLGPEYKRAFDVIYPELAAKYGALYYPFFLDGVSGRADLTLSDGMHPNAAGVERMVQGILPSVRALIAALGDKSSRG